MKPQKVVIYGPEGIGKSTFAAQFPRPLFIDTEGGTGALDVRRLQQPQSWTMLMEQVTWVREHAQEVQCQTLVIDTADWAERLCVQHMLSKNNWDSIEAPGYGQGYVRLAEEFGRLLDALQRVIDSGLNVVLTAHAMMRKFEQPDEMGSYDRWELKLQKKTAPLVKEWADMLLFANYKTNVININGKSGDKGKYKAQGNLRVMYTVHDAAWDAKNRHGLDEMLPFTFEHIAHCVVGAGNAVHAVAQSGIPGPHVHTQTNIAGTPRQLDDAPIPYTPSEPPKTPRKEQPPHHTQTSLPTEQPAEDTPPQHQDSPPDGIPPALWQLMQENDVTEEQIRMAVSKRGYFPYDTPIEVYGMDFINGVLIGAWPQIYAFIQENKDEMPF